MGDNFRESSFSTAADVPEDSVSDNGGGNSRNEISELVDSLLVCFGGAVVEQYVLMRGRFTDGFVGTNGVSS